MGWLIALAILLALAVLPLGVRAVYRESQPGVFLLIGPLKLKVYPGKPKDAKDAKPKKAQPKATQKKTANGKKKTSKGGSYRDFLPVVKRVLDFLCEFRRKIRVNNLVLKLVLAGDDPCDLVVNYGKAWAALGNFMPQLERFFVIKKRNLEVECDFTADSTLIFFQMDATITIARVLYLLSWHGVRILRELFKLKKLRKGGVGL